MSDYYTDDTQTGRMPDGDIGGPYTDAGTGLSGWLLVLARAPFTDRERRAITALLALMHPIRIGSWYDLTAGDVARVTGMHDTKARLAVRGLVGKGVLLRQHDHGNRGAIALRDPKSWFFLAEGGPNRCGPNEDRGPVRSASERPDRSACKGGRGDNNIYLKNNNINKNIYLNNTTTTNSGGNERASFESARPDSVSGGGDSYSHLRELPRGLTERERLVIGWQTNRLDTDTAQQVVDVLIADREAGRVREPIRYLGGLLKRLRAGTFDPAPGYLVRIRRERGPDEAPKAASAKPSQWTNDQVYENHARLMGISVEEWKTRFLTR